MEQNIKDDGAQDRSGALAFGMFLCTVGAALTTVVVARLGVRIAGFSGTDEKYISPFGALPLFWCISFVGAIVLLFWSINSPARRGRSYEHSSYALVQDSDGSSQSAVEPERSKSARWLTRVEAMPLAQRIMPGAALLLLSFFLLTLIAQATAADSSPEQDRFALVFEPRKDSEIATAQVNTAKPEDYSSADVDGGAKVSGTAEDRAVLLWNAAGSSPGDRREGLLVMFLGCNLTIAFGLFYPRMTLNAANDTGGFVQKLVVPLISLGLFGLGAQQQAKAEEVRQDVELAKRGLPPVMFLPHGERVRVLNRDHLGAATIDYLLKSLNAQEARFVEADAARAAEISDIVKAIQGIGSKSTVVDVRTDSPQFRELIESTNRLATDANSLSTATAGYAEVVRAEMKQAGEQFADDRKRAVDDARGRYARDCRALRIAAESYSDSSATYLQIAKEADAKRERDIFRKVWLGLKGEDRGLIRKNRDAATGEALAAKNELQRRLSELCPPDAQVAVNQAK